HQRVTPFTYCVKFAQIPIQRLECNQRVKAVDQPVEDRLHAASVLLVEKLWKSREGQRYPLCPSIFSGIDHIDAGSFVDSVGRAAPPPRHFEGDFAAATGCGVSVKSL